MIAIRKHSLRKGQRWPRTPAGCSYKNVTPHCSVCAALAHTRPETHTPCGAARLPGRPPALQQGGCDTGRGRHGSRGMHLPAGRLSIYQRPGGCRPVPRSSTGCRLYTSRHVHHVYLFCMVASIHPLQQGGTCIPHATCTCVCLASPGLLLPQCLCTSHATCGALLGSSHENRRPPPTGVRYGATTSRNGTAGRVASERATPSVPRLHHHAGFVRRVVVPSPLEHGVH